MFEFHNNALRKNRGLYATFCLFIAVVGFAGYSYLAKQRSYESYETGVPFPKFTGTGESTLPKKDEQLSSQNVTIDEPKEIATATFGAGCFWCTEAIFQTLRGVESAVSGYSGGYVENPTYGEVCSGTTGHAEVIQVTYDPSIISYVELLEVFWRTHDPTTLNRQGHDVGSQYRSVVFYHNEQQQELARHYKKKLDDASVFYAPIVTEISHFTRFYAAENDHQEYYKLHSRQSYCSFVIRPKLDKFKKVFHKKLKPDS